MADQRTVMALEQQAVEELLAGALQMIGEAPAAGAPEQVELNNGSAACYIALAGQAIERFAEAARGA